MFIRVTIDTTTKEATSMNNSYYKNVYMSLRNSMINREMGDKLEDAVLIDCGEMKLALKEAVPSSALLIAYSMLYYPKWLSTGEKPVAMPIEKFIGGVNNPHFRLLFNPYLAMIAASIGSYAGFWTLEYSKLQRTVMITPNVSNPLVAETLRRIRDEQITFAEAREVFIELMTDDTYAATVPLADDYIANASFIADQSASSDGGYEGEVNVVDFAESFEKEQAYEEAK